MINMFSALPLPPSVADTHAYILYTYIRRIWHHARTSLPSENEKKKIQEKKMALRNFYSILLYLPIMGGKNESAIAILPVIYGRL